MTIHDADADDFVGYKGNQTIKRQREERRIEIMREEARTAVDAWIVTSEPTEAVQRALEILNASPHLPPMHWDDLTKEEQTNRRRRQRELTQSRDKAKVTVGIWIYLKEPAEPVHKALGVLGMPRYPDGRVDQYDPNENMAATESGGP